MRIGVYIYMRYHIVDSGNKVDIVGIAGEARRILLY